VNNTVVADALSFASTGPDRRVPGCPVSLCEGSQLVRKRSGDLVEKLRTMMSSERVSRFEGLEIKKSQQYGAFSRPYRG